MCFYFSCSFLHLPKFGIHIIAVYFSSFSRRLYFSARLAAPHGVTLFSPPALLTKMYWKKIPCSSLAFDWVVLWWESAVSFHALPWLPAALPTDGCHCLARSPSSPQGGDQAPPQGFFRAGQVQEPAWKMPSTSHQKAAARWEFFSTNCSRF